MFGLSEPRRLRSRGLTLPLALLSLLTGCSALAAVVVAADLVALSHGSRASETRTGPLVAAVEKTLQEPRRTTSAEPRAGETASAAEAHRRATLMMLFDGGQDWGDLLLRR